MSDAGATTGRLHGKVAIVTGAGRGLGRGIALALGREGARVVVASRTQSTVSSVVDELVQLGAEAIGVATDVGVRADIEQMVARTLDTWGRVDVLVNNAQSWGTGGSDASPPFTRIEDLGDDEWDLTMRTGVTATLRCMQAAFPALATKGGVVINLGSGLGLYGGKGTAAYNCSKEAIRALSRTAAREWGKHGIRVNVIVPAARTESMSHRMDQDPAGIDAYLKAIPLGRFGDPEADIGRVAVFLASDDASYITGSTVMVDGGMLIES